MKKNKFKIFRIPKYYNCVIFKDGTVKVFSNSKHAKGRELSQWIDNNGYLTVRINNRGIAIHNIVSKCYLGNKPKNLVVNHIDGNKLNNNPNNLEYITISENIKHAVNNNLHVCNFPEKSGRYKHGNAIKSKIKNYKKSWYENNKLKILEKLKEKYKSKKV